jgi:hypothetical protein
MNKRAAKHKSATENAMLKFLTVSTVSSDGIVKGIIDDIKTAVETAPTFENDGYLHISFALLYSLLQKRLLTCTLFKLCLTQVLFNKHRMQVKCTILRLFIRPSYMYGLTN